MADGGDGILEALGGPNRTSVVTGPLGDPLTGTVAAVEGHRRDRDGPRQRAGDRRWRRAQRPARRVDDRHGRTDRPRPRRRRPADHRGPRRLGDHRRRLRRHPGDHGDRAPQAGGAARRLRRHHAVHAGRRGLRPAEGRLARAGEAAHRPAGAPRADVPRGVRGRRHRRSRAVVRPVGSAARSPRSVAGSFPVSNSSPTNSISTTTSTAPTS